MPLRRSTLILTLTLTLTLLSLGNVTLLRAQSSDNTPPSLEEELSPADQALLNEALLAEDLELTLENPTWLKDITIVTAGGYKDNVTLANRNPSASPFIYTGLEIFLTRLPKENQFLDSIESFVIFDDTRFTDSPNVEKEQLGFAQASIRKNLGPGWRLSLTGEYLYQDQVLDVSVTEADLSRVLVVGHSAGIQPGIRRALSSSRYLEMTFPIKRQFFDEPLDDYWAIGPQFTLSQNYGNRSRLTLIYESTFRRYDNDRALDENGFRIPDSSRKLNLNELRVGWRHYWDAKRRWRTYFKAGYKFTLDGASEYFNYKKPFASIQCRYQRNTWELSAESRFNFYYYPVQKATDSDSQRDRKELTLRARAQKNLNSLLTLFAEYEFERTYSNDSLDEFHVNKVTGGLNWRF